MSLNRLPVFLSSIVWFPGVTLIVNGTPNWNVELVLLGMLMEAGESEAASYGRAEAAIEELRTVRGRR